MTQQTIIGIDLAKHVFQVCMVTPTGTLKTNTAVARGKLLAWMARQPPALIFMEACGGAHDWARRFGALGHEVRLLAPQYVTPFRRGQKNDPNDALALTEAGQRPHIPTVPIKTVEQQDIQALHRVRERLIKNRTALVNQVRGLLLEYGIVIPQGIARFRKRLPRVIEEAENGLSLVLRDLLQSLLSELSALDTRITLTFRRARLTSPLSSITPGAELQALHVLWTAGATTLLHRLKRLKDVVSLSLNRQKGIELLERIASSDLSAADQARVSGILRTMLKLPDGPGHPPSSPEVPAARRRQRPST
jgi:transposase